MRDFGAFKSITADEFLELKEENPMPIIDVRREDEWRLYGVIEKSEKITFFEADGSYDLEKFMEKFTKVVTDKEQPFILVCAHANRTKSIGELLGLQLEYKNVYELDGGINYGWIDQGLVTVK
jgi:rhodanese-related sulfurtransferase